MHTSATFPADPRSPSAARRFVLSTLDSWELTDLGDTAALLVSELVTNALLHTGSATSVVIRGDPASVRVEVQDSSAVLPRRRRFGVESATGRGLALVDQLSANWGAEPAPGGKIVWFCLATEPTGSATWAEFDLDAVPSL